LALSLAGCASAPETLEDTGPPATALAQFEAAVAAMGAEDYASAEPMLEALIDDWPELSGPPVNLAIVYSATGRDEEAVAAFRSLLAEDPGNAVAWSELAIVLRRRGEFQAADEAYAEALELRPDYARAWRNRGILLDLYLQEPEEALEHYERYAELTGGSDTQVEKWIAELRMRLGVSDSRVAGR
jgi:tetratricopeptide (TPR) repeat protein